MSKKYNMDMSGESDPAMLLDEGWHTFEVVKIEEDVSKAGNQMFKISLVLEENIGVVIETYAIAEKGKRWFLKQFLAACDVPASQDGIYDWDFEDVLGKFISALIQHEESEWIDRNGNSRITKKNKIRSFRKP